MNELLWLDGCQANRTKAAFTGSDRFDNLAGESEDLHSKRVSVSSYRCPAGTVLPTQGKTLVLMRRYFVLVELEAPPRSLILHLAGGGPERVKDGNQHVSNRPADMAAWGYSGDVTVPGS